MTALHKPPKAAMFMTRNLVTVAQKMSLKEATALILEQKVSNAPVVINKGNYLELVGFLSERDCLEYISNEFFYANPDQNVETMMRVHPVCISPDADVFTVASIFIQHNYRHLPVTRNKELLGIVSRRDILKALFKHYDEVSKDMGEKWERPDLSQIVNHRFIVE